MTDWVKEANKLKTKPKANSNSNSNSNSNNTYTQPKTPLLRKRETKDPLDPLFSTAILVLAFWAGYILTADYYALRYGIFCVARYCGA